jgi:cellulose synthase operon protein C
MSARSRVCAAVSVCLLLAAAAARADEPPPSSEAAKTAYAAAAALQNREAWELAAEEWQAFIAAHQRDPLATNARYYLGLCRIKQKQWADAATTLGEFVAAAPTHPQSGDALYLLGEALWQSDKRDEAVAAWQRFVREQPRSPRLPDALYAVGVGEAQTGKKTEAAATLARFAKEFPQHPLAADVAIWRADLALAANQPAAADTLLAPVAASAGPRQAEALDRLGTARWNQKQWAPAAEAFAQLVAKHPTSPLAARATLAAGRAWLEAGRPDDARPLLEKAAAGKDPEAFDAAHRLARLDLDAKRPQPAADRASQALAAAKGRADIAANTLLDLATDRADALLALGKHADAAKAYQELAASHQKSDRRPDWLLLAVRALRDAGDRPAALALAEKLVADHPSGAHAEMAWYRVGQLRQDAGTHAAAVEAFAACVKAAPQGPRAAWALLASGWCHEAQKQLPEAIASWTAVIDQHPQSAAVASALVARSDARQRTGDYAGGLADAQRLLAAVRDKKLEVDAAAATEARLLEGLCLAGEKKYAQAGAAFTALLREHPKFPAADRGLFELGVVQTLDGKRSEAAATFASLVAKHPQSRYAAEAWLEVGEARWEEKKWAEAAAAYTSAVAAAGKAGGRAAVVREQARHKLGWTHAMRGDHAAAAQAFAAQLADAPQGAFAADAQAMLGGSLLALGRAAEAEPAFAKALTDTASLSSAALRDATFIRAAEAAAAQEKWAESLAVAEKFLAAAPQSPQVPQGRYAAAWARQNLGKLDEALAGYRVVADGPRTDLAARARLMEGEVLFEQGQHKDAIKAFFKTAYGFGEQAAPAPFHPWQAQATFEAARCFEVLGQSDQARKLYAELVSRYPDSEHVPAARKRLDALGSPAASGAPTGDTPK